jgi:hypothetical protein
MKNLKPYWFLESPIDTEHKYYMLMAFLVNLKKSFQTKQFVKKFKELLTIKRDLESFDKNTEFTSKTLSKMTEEERDLVYTILDNNLDNIEEVESIVKNSIRTIENFLDENSFFYEKYNSLVSVESYCAKYNLWDQGFLVIRKRDEEFMKVFTWFFSIVKVGKKENVALLMTELLDPLCENTNEIGKIRKFLKANIRDFSDQYDCVLVADVSDDIDIETGTDISKEKSIDLIMNKFKN